MVISTHRTGPFRPNVESCVADWQPTLGAGLLTADGATAQRRSNRVTERRWCGLQAAAALHAWQVHAVKASRRRKEAAGDQGAARLLANGISSVSAGVA